MSAPGVRHLHAIIGAVPSYAIASQTVFRQSRIQVVLIWHHWAHSYLHDMIRSQGSLSKDWIFDGSWLCAGLSWIAFGTVEYIYLSAYAWT